MLRTQLLVAEDEYRAAKSIQRPVDPARRQLIAIGEASPDFIATIDVQGNILYLNPAARRMLGISPDGDVSRRHIADAYPIWASVTILGEGIETAILDGVWRGETALRTFDGRELPVSQTIVAQMRADGECDYLAIVARDISELAATERALRRSEQFYRRIVETASVGMWVIDPADRVAFANPAMARALGYTVEELIGLPLATVIDTDRQTSAAANGEVSPGVPTPRTFRFRCKDGSAFPAGLATSALYDAEECYAGVLGVLAEKDGPRSN